MSYFVPKGTNYYILVDENNDETNKTRKWNFDELLSMTWEYCNMIRIYTKPKGAIPDYNEPVILSRDRKSLGDLCDSLHKEIRKNFKYAWVWGSSVKHQPQKCGLAHELDDEDIVQIVKK